MFLSTNKCEGIGECIKICPTEAIRLINDKAFSCTTCGACQDACPNQAIFENRYGGFVVDRAKCNGCGICQFTCPVDSIHIEKDNSNKKAIVKGICARCGVCIEACPSKSRIDGFDLIEDKQLKFLKSLNLSIPTHKSFKKSEIKAKRNCVDTDVDECILCGRCEYYCPTKAIIVKNGQKNVCTQCRVCVDVCPADAINKGVIDHDKCVLCLNCLKNCPNNAIIVENFKVNIIKTDEEPTGSIVSCLNCGLCVDNSACESLKQIDGKIRYDPVLDIDSNEIANNHKVTINKCPVSTLKLENDSKVGLKGYCVSCGKCVKVCDRQNARNFKTITWEGNISDDCISCGICSEMCPKEAITLKRDIIKVDLEKCILCETCGIYCPVSAVPKTTMAKKSIVDGFNLIDNKLCMNCKLCYKVCPEDAIIDREDVGMMMVDDDKCIYCGACKNICPTRAFIFEREFESLI